jgi:hypothetical protein
MSGLGASGRNLKAFEGINAISTYIFDCANVCFDFALLVFIAGSR